MSPAPNFSLSNLFGGLDADELIAHEEEDQTAEPPAPSTLGKRPSPAQDDEGDDEEEPSNSRGEDPPGRSDSTTHSESTSLQMGQAIRRAVKRLRLSDENIALVEQFSQVSVTNLPLRTST